MIINNTNIGLLTTGFNAAFSTGLGSVPPLYQNIAMQVKSSTASNTYAWLGDIPGMREWLGDRVINSLGLHGYTITNKAFEATVGVKRHDIEDDQFGVYTPVFNALGEAAARHPNELTFNLLKKGTTTACYDGQNFFDHDHPVLDEHGKERSASNIFGAGSGPAWYLMCLTRTIKPLIFQDRATAKFTYLNTDTAENVFMRNEYLYGADMRCNVGFGLWQLAVMSKEPLTSETYEAARAMLTGMTGDYGKSLAITGDTLLVPTALEGAALRVTEAELTALGGVAVSNVWAKTAKTLASPWL